MAGFSDFLEGAILDHVLQGGSHLYTPPPSVWASLHTGDPGDDGIGLEFTGMSYVRKQVTFSLASSGAVSNTAPLTWLNLPALEIQWIVIYDAETGGNPLFLGALLEPKNLNSGDSFTVNTGLLNLSLD